MKNFNVILIACLTFILLTSSGCSKNEEEESPYKREQIIGKWFIQSYWIEDKYGNGHWEDKPDFGYTYDQFNDDGTYYTRQMHSDKSSWVLKGITLYTKLDMGDGDFDINTFEIEGLTEKTLIINRHAKYPNISKYKLINEKYMSFTYTTQDVIGKWIYKSEFKDGEWVDYPNFGYYYNDFRKGGKFLKQNDISSENSWFIDQNTIFCKIIKSSNSIQNISYKIESIKEKTMIVIRQQDGASLKYIKE